MDSRGLSVRTRAVKIVSHEHTHRTAFLDFSQFNVVANSLPVYVKGNNQLTGFALI